MNKADLWQRAYAAGRKVFKQSVKVCPYKKGTVAYDGWQMGYLKAKEESFLREP